jgi:hypothetical protein
MSELMRSGDVVSMMDRLSQNQFPACALVEAYWHSQKPKNSLPKRSAIDPRGIEDALNYAFILESIGTGCGAHPHCWDASERANRNGSTRDAY